MLILKLQGPHPWISVATLVKPWHPKRFRVAKQKLQCALRTLWPLKTVQGSLADIGGLTDLKDRVKQWMTNAYLVAKGSPVLSGAAGMILVCALYGACVYVPKTPQNPQQKGGSIGWVILAIAIIFKIAGYKKKNFLKLTNLKTCLQSMEMCVQGNRLKIQALFFKLAKLAKGRKGAQRETPINCRHGVEVTDTNNPMSNTGAPLSKRSTNTSESFTQASTPSTFSSDPHHVGVSIARSLAYFSLIYWTTTTASIYLHEIGHQLIAKLLYHNVHTQIHLIQYGFCGGYMESETSSASLSLLGRVVKKTTFCL